MASKPTFAELIDGIDGRSPLTPAQEAAADTHDLLWLQTMHRLSQQITLAEPPPPVRQNLQDRFAQFAANRQAPNWLQRLTAALSFDSHAPTALVGVRSAASIGAERQLIYSSDVADVALNTQTQDGQLGLLGQVFLLDETADPLLSVQLVQNGREVNLTHTNDLGEFSFVSVPTTPLAMIISSDHFELTISPLHLQA